MLREPWMRAALALVGVLTAEVAAQDGWRPADRPPVIRGVSRSVAGVALGRPVPTRQLDTPGTFPTAYRKASPLRDEQPSYGVQPIPTVPQPGAVIATSTRNAAAAEGEPEVEPEVGGFATDRNGLKRGGTLKSVAVIEAPPFLPNLPDRPMPLGNWKSTYPVDGPPPPLPEPFYEELGASGPRFYFGAEYLLWWTKGDKAPPLATAGPNDPNVVSPGALGDPGTLLLRDGELFGEMRSGARFTAGWFLDPCGEKAIEISGFFLGTRSTKFDANSAQYPVIARPFFALATGTLGTVTFPTESSELVSFPGRATGRIHINGSSALWGVEANWVCGACCGCDWRANWLAGPRFVSLSENLKITEEVNFLSTANPVDIAPFQPRDRFTVNDSFSTRNRFWGGQVGAEGRWLQGRWTVDGRAKLGLGLTEQEVTINGSQIRTRDGSTTTFTGGLLALSSNIGTHRRASFSFLPEVGMSVGYYATDWMRISFGYNLLYWSSVVRPGGQVDRNLNVFNIPNFDTGTLVNSGENRPTVPFKTTDYWAQGLTLGVELNF
ncbi:MAG: hypothetical protein EBV06_08175 [Planctomycetia bacterium]|nr:hypothetical protein [Planctomycetia bacterium]